MATLHLNLLGGFAAHTPLQQPVEISNRKNQALLAFLALNPGRRLAREKLIDLLWGEGDGNDGRNSLRQALALLRKDLVAIELQPITVDGEILSVSPDAVEVDVLTFEHLSRSEQIDDLIAAVALYRGDLLAGFAFGESGFEEWLGPERSRLREIAIDVYTRLVPNLAGAESIGTAKRLVDMDLLRESSQCLLIAHMAEQGQTELALQQFRLYSEALERELGIAPSAAAQALQRAIAGGRYEKSETGRPAANDAVPRRHEKLLIAVLPFENRSADPKHQQLCDALAGDVADALSRVDSFVVVARSATAGLRGSQVDVRRIGSELGADYVLHGSVHRLAERLRISVQLSATASGFHVWTEQYDSTVGAATDLHETIIPEIIASVETQAWLATGTRFPHLPADGVTVQDLISRGVSLLYDETPDSLAEALALAERAVALAPAESRVHALRADAFVQRVAARAVEFDPDLVARGVDLARTAVGMSPGNEWTHLCLARIHIEADQLDAAIADAERALEINSGSVIAFARLSECYALLGRSEDAIDASRSALRLDPRGPESYMRHFTMAMAHFAAGNDPEAFIEAGSAARWHPDYTRADLMRAATATALGHKDEAGVAVAHCLKRYPDLRAELAMPRVMPPFARAADRARLIALLVEAGLPA